MQAVDSVAIVGAGTAGWVTALSLSTYCPSVKVTLVRPRSGQTIGVGESTQGNLPQLLQAARLDVGDVYRASDATLKCGIYYTDWNVVGRHYWHPFADVALGPARLDYGPNYTVAHHYQQMILRDPARYQHRKYYQAVHSSYETCVTRKEVSKQAAIAFHIDAQRFIEHLEQKLPQVEVREADKVDIQVADGRVSQIVLDGGTPLTADLYADCTGFKKALIGRVSPLTLLPYTANVNRAVAAQVPYLDGEAEATPYTGAHAHEHGWTWSIPLQNRIGSGYVYHSDFCTPDEAETNFRDHWGHERMRDVAVSHIPFDSATLRDPWVENVVAIGLSAGFVEPLEATGLSWMITSAAVVCRALADRFYDEDRRTHYNATLRGFIYDIHDFIDVHYKLSARRDSDFWRHQTARAYPERLEHRLDLFAKEMPTSANRVKTSAWAFHEVSWMDILNGYDFKYARLKLDPRTQRAAEQALKEIARRPREGGHPLHAAPPSR